jgi:hypothetical protein
MRLWSDRVGQSRSPNIAIDMSMTRRRPRLWDLGRDPRHCLRSQRARGTCDTKCGTPNARQNVSIIAVGNTEHQFRSVITGYSKAACNDLFDFGSRKVGRELA